MSKKPTYTAYVVREGKEEGQKGFWMQIGAAWTNKDGSFSITLDAVPVNGRIVLRKREDKPESGDGDQQ